MLVLGIETSCDETAAAVVADATTIRSSIVATQFDVHARYGGIVPELACRRHTENILPVIRAALSEAGATLDDIDLIAVTRGPGLIGALLVGLSCAKALAYATATPCVGVNHLEGHLVAPILEGAEYRYPLAALVVSGGHTELYRVDGPGQIGLLGQTLDDAAGEAFDKVATLLGLGFPGGPTIDRLSAEGDPQAVAFPRALLDRDTFEFSFSGVKTAVKYFVDDNAIAPAPFGTEGPPGEENWTAGVSQTVKDVAASFQAAVVDVLVAKSLAAVRHVGTRELVVAGGVACNRELRARLEAAADADGLTLHIPSPPLCTDNAAMIAAAGALRVREEGWPPEGFLAMDAVANLPLAPALAAMDKTG
ncbi:MAG: tRNA (adenosine(37)-N6)-threonylcarbamoyltransferase complex transferase subunit TsaD [Candidatus Tectimicrobiota bacterium]